MKTIILCECLSSGQQMLKLSFYYVLSIVLDRLKKKKNLYRATLSKNKENYLVMITGQTASFLYRERLQLQNDCLINSGESIKLGHRSL